MIDTTELQNLVTTLNPSWFNEKKRIFKQEELYNKEHNKIYDTITETELVQYSEEVWKEVERNISFDIDLPAYCWNSFFYGSISYKLDPDSTAPDLPVDSGVISDGIIQFINRCKENFTDVIAINAVIEEVVNSFKYTVDQMKQASNDPEYTAFLAGFFLRVKQEIHSEFKYISRQIEFKKAYSNIERKLTPEICSKIALFKVDGNKLITNVEGPLNDKGQALFQLLTPGSVKTLPIKIRVEDWNNQDVYYLLKRLSEIFTNSTSVADIERKKMLFLRKQKLFVRNLYDKFKSANLDSYCLSNPRKEQIDAQINSLL